MKQLHDLLVNYSIVSVERALSLPHGFLSNPKNLVLPETIALIKMISLMPWLLTIAENNYDPDVARIVLREEASKYTVWGNPEKESIIL